MILTIFRESWIADIVNYLVTNDQTQLIGLKMMFTGSYLKFDFFLEEQYLFKYCSEQIIRRCISDKEIKSVLSFCHELACGGHFNSRKNAEKVLQSGFY